MKDYERIDRAEQDIQHILTAIKALTELTKINHEEIQHILNILEKMTTKN